MRILHLDTGRALQGGQLQVIRLIQELAPRGHEQVVVAPRAAALFHWAARAGVPRVELTYFALRDAARDAHIIHCHDARSHTLALALFHPCLVVSRRVGFPLGRGPLSRWKYRRAARLLAVSQYVRDVLVRYGLDESRVEVVYDAVPESPLSDRAGDILILPKCGGILDVSGLGLRVSSDLAADLPHARALVYLSRMEGLGSAALLALAHGVPVIASRVGGLPEVVQHEETGLLIDNTRPALEAALRRLDDQPALADRCAHAGRDLAVRRHAPALMAERTRAIYGQVLSL